MLARPSLLQVVQAGRSLGLFLGPAQRRQQHGRQNGDDGDDHQQFNQGEPAVLRFDLHNRSFFSALAPSARRATPDHARRRPNQPNPNSYLRVHQAVEHRGIGRIDRDAVAAVNPARHREPGVGGGIQSQGHETIFDLGAVSGYFSFRFARALPRGKVIAAELIPRTAQRNLLFQGGQ